MDTNYLTLLAWAERRISVPRQRPSIWWAVPFALGMAVWPLPTAIVMVLFLANSR